MDTMKSTGVTSVTVGFSGDKNPDLQVNELDVIAVGYVGFTQVIDVTAWLQRKLQPGAALIMLASFPCSSSPRGA